MKRQTVTLTRRFLELTAELSESDRLIVYDKILTHLFNEIPIDTKDESDAVRVTIACLAPELRIAQVRFDNGKISKKLKQISQGEVCHFEGSKPQASDKQATSKNGISDSSFLNNNIYNNIYNNHIISDQEKNKKEELAQSDPNKREWFADAVLQQLERIKEVDGQVHQKMQQVVHAVAQASEPYNIRNGSVLPETVLEQYLEFFRTDDLQLIVDRLGQTIARVAQAKTNNRNNYLIASLYQEAKNNL